MVGANAGRPSDFSHILSNNFAMLSAVCISYLKGTAPKLQLLMRNSPLMMWRVKLQKDSILLLLQMSAVMHGGSRSCKQL